MLSNLNVYRDEFLKQMVAFRGNRKQDVLDALIKQREELTQKYMNDPSKIEIVAKNSSARKSKYVETEDEAETDVIVEEKGRGKGGRRARGGKRGKGRGRGASRG